MKYNIKDITYLKFIKFSLLIYFNSLGLSLTNSITLLLLKKAND